MCDYFLQRMEGDQHHQAGDLTDVVRAGGAMHQQAGIAELSSSTATGWQLPAEPTAGPGLFPPPQPSSSDGAGPSGDDFADAFAGLPDPFASDFVRASSSGGGPGPADFFDFEAPAAVGGARRGVLVDSGGGVVERGVQMPALSPREIRPYPPVTMIGGDAVKIGVPAMMPGLAVGPACAFDAIAGMQMPSPHGGGIKRRFGTTRDRCQI